MQIRIMKVKTYKIAYTLFEFKKYEIRFILAKKNSSLDLYFQVPLIHIGIQNLSSLSVNQNLQNGT